ncbi:hypothetical protein PTSG_08010 [Salpingoeca rosetta]|uniref:C2H2-type domain-containing protein n=1 Tax=Salpingoeca rosetta (strain ATCC 50818 / BSB-021) TaxID=946362 RepID=F2UHR1_SALR5|nr:uncharacterized protein PTSG_08010 [Salpingoeca rosetta]EGD76660.1 hypothetical protein PTSG_08010 [Salpingoeca rosetta]|eukprot:XP_004991032.1 hypothetical protein PTSG_08010 [Salpingoeca rosetta]
MLQGYGMPPQAAATTAAHVSLPQARPPHLAAAQYQAFPPVHAPAAMQAFPRAGTGLINSSLNMAPSLAGLAGRASVVDADQSRSARMQAFLDDIEARRRFKCPKCDKRFTTSSNLSRHKRIHTGVKPYACKYCRFRFNNSSNRNKHEAVYCKQRPSLRRSSSSRDEDTTRPPSSSANAADAAAAQQTPLPSSSEGDARASTGASSPTSSSHLSSPART